MALSKSPPATSRRITRQDLALSLADRFPRSLKLLSEFCKLLLQVRDLALKVYDCLFQMGDSVAVRPDAVDDGTRAWLGIPLRSVSGEQMREPSFLGAGLPGKQLDHGRVALHEALQRRVHHAQIVKRMHAFG